MRKRRAFNNLLYWCNLFVALLLLISFVLPYLPPKTFPTLSLLSLVVSLLIIVNIIFAIYWAVQFRRRFFVSFLLLAVSYFYFNVFFEISSEGDASEYENTLSVLSYNVRLFNAYEENPKEDAQKVISEILKEQAPDVICIQEFYKPNSIQFTGYPYKYIHFKSEKAKLGHAIFSKYPLIKTGAFDFAETYNNTLYADVLKNKDTIRVYSVHLQSLGIIPRVSFLQESDNEKLRKRVSTAFEKQQNQVFKILEHKSKVKYRTLVCGDFNNTPFSYSYRKLKEGMQDAFRERGNGLGTTFKFEKYPMRIDYIFASEDFEVLSFETLNNTFSDHYAIRATLGW
ncbi:endonuclease/exonuclease/phosphatase family protein [Aequorivita echinoideorum]|uniref:Endonuclease/exonuclease/phosphatase family protein n=1 Tax=Aequorivita echinoideorum TaxID=1549647 RepID=A0ABS5S7Y4_9FLAO|nr:endonuclease/exonuclease/phosphatase family protein [Aequorivita echinoideorum]MBT0608550.1 endonuclease/exonuclease/phosphatase family protein [Aequorivita echinoideorum]